MRWLRRESPRPKVACGPWLAAWAAAATCSAAAAPLSFAGASLTELALLEQLGNIEVTSVSRRAQRLSDAPTSVFVITAEDIRRSGAASLPEALRLAPNLQVARSSNEGYSISARGLDSALSNKLLVLIDGRSVYTPLYSGVFWDAQDVVLEDIDRIEVISGSGATLWGVNAVNGVINVITRAASERAGALGSADIGERQRRVTARYGGSAGALHYTFYGLHTEIEGTRTAAGAPTRDAARHVQAGLRIDAPLADGTVTLIGDVSRGRLDQPPGTTGAQALQKSGANLLLRYEGTLAGGTLMLQAYGEHTRRESPPTYNDTQDIVDLELLHTFAPIGPHVLSGGFELKRGRDSSENSPFLAFLPAVLPQTWGSVYLQDEVTLAPELQLTLGLRAERNDYTGTETLPTLRAAWKPEAQQLVWAALTRAVRAPARLDRDLYVPGQEPFQLRGGPGFRSEVAKRIELGWRGQVGRDLTASATVFDARYSRLRSVQADPGGRSFTIANGIDARSHGLEAWGSYQARSGWRLHAGLGLLRQSAELVPGANDPRGVAALVGGNPRHWWMLRSSHDFGSGIELDVLWRGVAQRPATAVPSYNALSLRLGWRVQPALDLALGVRDLAAGGRHAEFGTLATRAVFEPEAYLRVEARF